MCLHAFPILKNMGENKTTACQDTQPDLISTSHLNFRKESTTKEFGTEVVFEVRHSGRDTAGAEEEAAAPLLALPKISFSESSLEASSVS